jgi:hypothetical protein
MIPRIASLIQKKYFNRQIQRLAHTQMGAVGNFPSDTIKSIPSVRIDPFNTLKIVASQTSLKNAPLIESVTESIPFNSHMLESDLKSILADLLKEAAEDTESQVKVMFINGETDLIFHLQNDSLYFSFLDIHKESFKKRFDRIQRRAQDLGGDLEIVPMQGNGLNFYLFLKKKITSAE